MLHRLKKQPPTDYFGAKTSANTNPGDNRINNMFLAIDRSIDINLRPDLRLDKNLPLIVFCSPAFIGIFTNNKRITTGKQTYYNPLLMRIPMQLKESTTNKAVNQANVKSSYI